MIKFRRKLNIVTGDPPAVIRMGQYDTDVILEFELYASDGIFTVDPGTEVVIRGVKPDGNGISIAGNLLTQQDRRTKENTYIARIEVAQQMTAAAGKAQYKLTLISSGKELNTGRFIVEVDRAALDKDTLPSSSVIREITETLDRTDDFLKASRSITKVKKEIAEKAQAAEDAAKSTEESKAAVELLLGEIREQAVTIGGLLKELETAKAAALKDIEAARREALTEINNRSDLLIAVNTQVEDTAKTALKTAEETRETVSNFINTQGNLRGRVDAIEAKVYEEVKG